MFNCKRDAEENQNAKHFLSTTGKEETNIPVNIRNIFKWFKCLQNVLNPYLNPILWFSKRFQANLHTVMFEKTFYKHSIYKRFYCKCLLNFYRITQEARFDWKHFLNVYKIAKEMELMLEMFFQTFITKRFIDSTHKMLKKHF